MSGEYYDSETHEHVHPNYWGVFIALAVLTAMITAIELTSRAGYIDVPRSVLNMTYLSISVAKAILVVLFYMHLKYDSRLYAVLFGMPCIFGIVFLVLVLV